MMLRNYRRSFANHLPNITIHRFTFQSCKELRAAPIFIFPAPLSNCKETRKTFIWLWLKCIVGQSCAKLGKVDMFSKEIIKKQSWQSWCIFLSIFKYNMQSKVGKVQIWIFYYRQSWQSWDKAFLIMDKYQTLGKVSKVGGTFGIIWLLLRIGKVGKVEI